jgi:hypothetical protein
MRQPPGAAWVGTHPTQRNRASAGDYCNMDGIMNPNHVGPILLAVLCCVWPLIVHGSIIWFSKRWKIYGLRGFIPRSLLRRRDNDKQI